MGQQQLLLLVLATVIVGLATVAGIEAFDQNQQQATVDALTQRGIELVTDMKAAGEKPTQFGGVDLSSVSPSDNADVAKAMGLSSVTGVSADGAGNDAECDIDPSAGTVKCGTEASSNSDLANSPQSVTVTLNSDGSISTTINSVNS